MDGDTGMLRVTAGHDVGALGGLRLGLVLFRWLQSRCCTDGRSGGRHREFLSLAPVPAPTVCA